MNMVSRIAKALAFTELTDKGRRECVWPDRWDRSEVLHYESKAIEVLKELREPDDAALEAASMLFKRAWYAADNNSRRDAWRAAIDGLKALEE